MPDLQTDTLSETPKVSAKTGPSFYRWLLPAFIVAIFASWFIEADLFAPQDHNARFVALEWRLKTTTAGTATVTLSDGNTAVVRSASVEPDGEQNAAVRVFVPRDARYRAITFSLLDRRSPILFQGARMQTIDGTWRRDIPAAEFHCAVPNASARRGEFLELSQLSGPPPEITAKFDPYAQPTLANTVSLDGALASFALVFPLAAVLFWILSRSPRAAGIFSSFCAKCRANPKRAIFACAVIGVVLSCYPVVFFGKSWVAANGGPQLSSKYAPTIQTGLKESPENLAGSDGGATMYIYYPYAFQAHRALSNDGELPLWNRNTWCGNTLIGQFGLMWGDPFQWPVILSGGAPWAWDLRVLFSRLIYALGCGLLVYRTCGNLRVSLLLTLSACFHGFFLFRASHPAVFGFSYMPWILLAWVSAIQARTTREIVFSGLTLIAATWQAQNSASAKEPLLTVIAMNVVGMGALLLTGIPWKARLGKLAAMGWANVLAALLSAPFWLLLVDSLRRGFSVYEAPKVFQLQPGLAIGLFDEVFQRQVCPRENMVSAGANFFILLGFLWSIAAIRRLRTTPVFVASGIALIGAGAIVFGAIPPSILATIPVLKTVSHFDITFSFLLFTPLLVVAGYGLTEMWNRANDPEWKWEYVEVVIIFVALLSAFSGFTSASHRTGLTVHAVGEQYYKSRFFISYALGISAALLALPWCMRAVKMRGRFAPSACVLAVVAFIAIHSRMGAHVETAVDTYVYNPKTRFDFREMKSGSFDFVKAATKGEPARVYGLNETLIPGFTSIPNLETICGADAFEPRMSASLYAAVGLSRSSWFWRYVADTGNYAQIQRGLDFLGVKYLFLEPKDPAPENLKIVHVSDMKVGESATAWPRAFFVDSVATVQSFRDIGNLVKSGDGRPFAAVDPRTLGPRQLPRQHGERRIARATNYHLTTNTTAFEIEASGPGISVLHETHVEGDFKATVNGVPAECLTVNGVFRGVWIDRAGKHRISFTFQPGIWTKSLIVGLVGLILSFATFVALRRRGALVAR